MRLRNKGKKAIVTYEIHTTYGNGRGSKGVTCNKYTAILDVSKASMESFIREIEGDYKYREVVILLIHEF